MNFPAGARSIKKPVVDDKPTVDLRSSTGSLAGTLATDDDDDGALFRLPAIEVQETWYPSVRKTLWVLSELHSFIAVSCLSASSVPRPKLADTSPLLSLSPVSSKIWRKKPSPSASNPSSQRQSFSTPRWGGWTEGCSSSVTFSF